MAAICEVWRLGCVEYHEAWELQNRLVAARSADEIPERLLLLEHPHTYTLGSSGHDGNLLLTPKTLAQRGIELVHSDRGGDITYHGPGQLIGYPIMRLPRSQQAGLRTDFVGYVRKLESVVIHTLADYGIVGKALAGLTGVWVATPAGEAKVCAMGVKINVRAVTKHGFALNITTDLSYYDGIIPCGIADKGVTSMAQLLGAAPDKDEVAGLLSAHFGAVFGFEMAAGAGAI